MGRTAGFIVRLSSDRHVLLQQSLEEGMFAEPVSEFDHSRNIPLVCFILDNSMNITHICLGKRGNLAGTDLRRLNLDQFFKLDSAIPKSLIYDHSPSRVKSKLQKKFDSGGLLPPKSFEALIQILSELSPAAATILRSYSEERIKRIESLSGKTREALGEQKEAVATALAIAGIDRDELLGWDLDTSKETSSFLDGLTQSRLREDSMVVNDLMNLPGYEVLKTTPYNSVVFENDQSKLTVILANRLPLEQQLGTDLIYYNETFSCFLMVQYKAMENEAGEAVYRLPNEQLAEEINRMKSVLVELKKCSSNSEADGYRLSENPFFLKMCPRIIFNPDNVGLVKGMYLPLEYWALISSHPSLVGPKGGKRLSYRNVRRYFDNSAFVTIASGGWIGTNIHQSSVLQEAIRSTLESGRAVVFAVNKEKDNRHRVNN